MTRGAPATTTRFPIVTSTVLLGMLAMALWVTGLSPTEASLSGVWWSRQAMADGEWWRLATATFAHGGPLHLLFNGIALWSLSSLERELGPGPFLGVFTASAIGAGVLHALTTSIPVVGASGAVFGLLGLVMVLYPLLDLYVFFVPVPAVLALGLYLAAFLMVPSFADAGPIAHAAHLGGLAVGAVSAFALRPRDALHHAPWIAVVLLGSMGLLGFLVAVDLSHLQAIYRTEGLLGLALETWPGWAAVVVTWLGLGELGRRAAGERAGSGRP